MYQRISRQLFIAALCLGLLACATSNPLEKQLRDQGATRLDAGQVRTHLSGKTQQWENGGAYFQADGTVYVKFAGKLYPERIWTVDDSGRTCIAFRDGFNTSCSVYYRYRDEIWVVTTEIFGEPQRPERPYRYRRDGSIDSDDRSIHGGPDTVLDGNRLDDI